MTMTRKKKTGLTGNNQLNGKKSNVTSRSGTIKKQARKKRNTLVTGDNKSGKNSNYGNTDNNSVKSILKLGNILSINNIKELHKTLGNLLDKNADVEIDASDVQSVDTAILQLLTVFCLKLEKNGRNIYWKNPTQTFIDRCCLLNLEESLKLI